MQMHPVIFHSSPMPFPCVGDRVACAPASPGTP